MPRIDFIYKVIHSGTSLEDSARRSFRLWACIRLWRFSCVWRLLWHVLLLL